jgi:16S rRNA (adenine1518-N6/adenine1519-N6)-dimethyltransferase
MRVYRPSELHAFLKEKGLYAKKGLSQNFLIDGNIVQKILTTASIQEGDFVVEIGPGPGALTQALLAKGARVLAVEMDPLFARELERFQTQDNRLEVVCQDILTFPLTERLNGRRVKVVANLPYHITTPILVQLLPLYGLVDSLTLMVQKEFAERMRAQPGTSDYSSFSIFLQFYADVVSHFSVSPHCFSPRPSVVSSVVHCKLHPPALETGSEEFFRLTRTAFGQRRKMLRSTLQSLYSKESIEQALLSIHRSVTVRPEELSLKEFIALYTQLGAPRAV